VRNIKTIIYISLTLLLLAFITYIGGYRLSAAGLAHELDRKIDFTPSEIIYNKPSENESTPRTTIIVSKHDNWIECRTVEKSLGFLWKQKGNPLEPMNLQKQDPTLTQYEILTAYVNRCSGLQTPVKGISSGNLNNGGQFTEGNGWVYAAIPVFDYDFSGIDLFKMKPDGSSRTKIGSGIREISLSKDRIYSIDPMQSMKTDGTDVKPLREKIGDYADCLLAIDDTLVFNSTDDVSLHLGFLYTIKTDGTGIMQLTTFKSKRVDFTEGWLYYVTSDKPALRRIRLDRTEDTLISEDVGEDFLILDGLIYYVSLKDGNKLYRMDLEGKRIQKLTDFAVSSLNTDKSKIYYINPKDQLIYAVNLDGSSSIVVSKHKAKSISYVSGNIYFTGVEDIPISYHINLSTKEEENTFKIYQVQPDPAGTPIVIGVGNTNLNLNSDAIFAEKAGVLYFSGTLYGIENGIYSINADGTNRKKIADVGGKFLNILGDYLYFMNIDDSGRIYRILTAGGEPQRITERSAANMILKDGWIYFTDMDQLNLTLMKIKTDGTGLKIINQKNPYGGDIQLDKDTLYFTSRSEDYSEGIYGMKTDGSGFITYTEESIYSITVDGDWIYYAKTKLHTSEWPMEIHRVNINGSSDTILLTLDKNISVKGVSGDYLYYIAYSMFGNSLQRIKLDGSKIETIVADSGENHVFHAFILQGKLITFQGKEMDEASLFISNLDGSNVTPFLK